MATLRDFLDALFAAGPVRFERFMREALYNEEFGYYTTRLSAIGSRGDFSTSVTLAPVLGTAVARWIESESAHFGGDAPVHLVEAGPGDGSLMRQVLGALPRGLRRRLGLHLVEISPRLAATQGETLGRFRKHITWHADLPAAADHIARHAPGPVLLYTNEFVDAFPVRIFRARPPGRGRNLPPAFDELHLGWDGTGLTEAWTPPGALPASTALSQRFPSGQRVEIHQSYRRMLQDALPRLAAGAILTVDYGAAIDSLYHRRPHGTLRAYWRHQRLEGAEVYARFGKQDLTTDVNFSDLAGWGEELGFRTIALQSQREFLAPHIRPGKPVEAFLADPAGPGEAFRVLHQRKG